MSHSRDKTNYPPKQKDYSCHHVAYTYSNYRGELEHTSPETAQQALDIATHYAMQKWILEEGGESFVKAQQEQLRFVA